MNHGQLLVVLLLTCCLRDAENDQQSQKGGLADFHLSTPWWKFSFHSCTLQRHTRGVTRQAFKSSFRLTTQLLGDLKDFAASRKPQVCITFHLRAKSLVCGVVSHTGLELGHVLSFVLQYDAIEFAGQIRQHAVPGDFRSCGGLFQLGCQFACVSRLGYKTVSNNQHIVLRMKRICETTLQRKCRTSLGKSISRHFRLRYEYFSTPKSSLRCFWLRLGNLRRGRPVVEIARRERYPL